MQKIQSDNVIEYILAGRARFTIQNKITSNRFTYKVTQSKDKQVYWIKVLRGRDNVDDYSYIGVLKNQRFFPSSKGGISSTAPSVKAFSWFINNINKLGPVEVFNEGRCMRCGRVLTTPESVSKSIGPECEKHF